MAKFEHGGIEITFNEMTGKFLATVGGKRLAKGSLDAMKKHIDSVAASSFTPIKVLRANGREQPNQYEVTGVERTKSWSGAGWEFRLSNGETLSPAYLMLDTPENRETYAKIMQHRDETDRIKKEREEELADLWSKITRPEPPTK